MNALYIIKTLCISLVLLVWSSGSSIGQETLTFHSDKAYYVTGEVMWYKVYLPRGFSGQNIPVKVYIADSKGEIVYDYFLKSEGRTFIHGYYKVPYGLDSGIYQIAFYLGANSGKEEKRIGTFPFSIYNDLEKIDNLKSISNEQFLKSSRNNSTDLHGLSVTITSPKNDISTREQMEAVIKVSDANGNPVKANISVSIVDADLIGQKDIDRVVSKGGDLVLNLTDIQANSIYRQGFITGNDGEPLLGNVIGAYSGLEKNMFYTKSDAEGRFTLSLPDFKGEKSIQLIGYIFEEHPNINIEFNSNLGIASDKSFGITGEIRNYIEESRKRKKIFQYYKKPNANIEIEKITVDQKDINPNGTFIIDEYEAFENMAEFFNELINSQLSFPKNKDGTYRAKMYNPEGRGAIRHFTGNPIFIIDGKITRDANFIGKMDLQYIETVDLYFITKRIRDEFGTFGNSAFVYVNTNLPEIKIPEEEEEDIFMIRGIQPSAQFEEISQEELTSNGPIFRPQIYWNPDLNTDDRGISKIRYNQSDDASQFMITVVAQSDDGRIGSSMIAYRVSLSP